MSPKTKIALFSILLLFLPAFSFSQVKIVKDNIACLYGLKNAKGEWVVPAEYILISEMDNWNIFILLKNNKYGLADYYGKIIIEPTYDRIFPISNTGKIFMVQLNGLRGVVDHHHKILVPINYKSIETVTDNLFICIDKKGKENLRDTVDFVKKNKFKNISVLRNSYGNGNKLILTGKKTGFHGVFSTSFDTLLDLSEYRFEENGWNYLLRRDSLVALTDNNFQIIFPLKYQELKLDYYNYFHKMDTLAFKENGKWGICHLNGEILCSSKFDEITPFYKRETKIKWKAVKDGKSGYIDHFGNEILPVIYDEIKYYDISEGKHKVLDFYQIKKDGLYGLLNTNFEERLPPKFALYHPDESHNVRYFSDSTEVYALRLKDTRAFYNHYDPKLSKGEIAWNFPEFDIFKFNYGEKYPIEYQAFEKINGIYQYNPDFRIYLMGNKIMIRYNNRDRFYDLQGIEIFDPLANKDLIGIGDSLYIYQSKNDKFGVINSKAEAIIDTNYKFILYASNQKQKMLWVKEFQNTDCSFNDPEACGWSLLNYNGNQLTESIFDFPVRTKSIGVYYTAGKAGFYDFLHLKPVVPPKYLVISPLFENEIFHFGLEEDSTFSVFKSDGTLLNEKKWKFIVNIPQKIDFTRDIFTSKVNDPYNKADLRYSTIALLSETDTLLLDESGNFTFDSYKIKKTFSTGMQLVKYEYNSYKSAFILSEKKNFNDSLLINKVRNYFYLNFPKEFRKKPSSCFVKCSFSLPRHNNKYFQNQKAFQVLKAENYTYLITEILYAKDKYACVKTDGLIRNYVNLKKSGDGMQAFTIDSLFKQEVDVNDAMTLLIADYIYDKDYIFLDCHNPSSLFQLTGKNFTFDDQGIYLNIKDQYGNNVEISIPWTKLQKYAPEKGIVADFVAAGKK